MGVSGLVWKLVTSASIETALFDLRPRVARRRPSIDEGRSRYCVGFSWGYGTPDGAFARICCIARGDDRRRVTSARRLMDADRGSTYGGLRAVAHLLAYRRFVELHHASHSGCRPGIAWTWGLVGGCSPFWMEAHRHSRPRELGLTPLLGCKEAREPPGCDVRSVHGFPLSGCVISSG